MKKLCLIVGSILLIVLLFVGFSRNESSKIQLEGTSWYAEGNTVPSLVFNTDGTYIFGNDTGTWETRSSNAVLQDTGTDDKTFQPIDIVFTSDYGEKQIMTIVELDNGYLTLFSDSVGEITYVDTP